MRYVPRMFWCAMTVLLFLTVCGVQVSNTQVVFGRPMPGDIYKEFSRTTKSGDEWRVTDPNVNLGLYPQAAPFLPNPTMSLSISDLAGAVRAEAVLTIWGGHVGTTGKKIRFNNRAWINIPELSGMNGIPAGHSGQCYISQVNVSVPVPLSDLVQGNNTFQGTNTGQTCYSFQWGQHGWYGIIVRVYYNSSKAHPTGTITSPSAGSTFGEFPNVAASVSGGADRVDFLAFYDGFDTDGDGIYQEYHHDYMVAPSDGSVMIRNHVGTVNGGGPYSRSWDNTWVPDQGGIKILARIRGTNGVWYVTPEVTGLTLARSGAYVRLYKPYNVPERAWARGDLPVVRIPVNITDNLANASAARAFLRLWNGIDVYGSDHPSHYQRLNNFTFPEMGLSHYYSDHLLNVPVGNLVSGTNTFSFYSQTTAHHGIEILWPGPMLMVRYGGSPSNNPPSITQHPTNQTAPVGQTATFSVGASGTAPLQYQWQKNGQNINGATNSSYTTPPVAAGDNGATFRCVVTNNYGNATSNGATLTVGGGGNTGPSITQHPSNQSAGVGQTATFGVVATGTAPLNYQWQKNNTNIGGATSSSYTTPAVSAADNGATFRCVVSNNYGTATSNAATLTVSAGGGTGANVLANGSFESGTTGWNFYTDGSGGFATVTPGTSGAASARVNIVTAGNNVQLYQSGFTLEPNTQYVLKFDGRASVGRTISMSVQKHPSPYTNYGLSSSPFTLGASWQSFSVTFTTKNFSGVVSDARLMIWLAAGDVAGDQYFFDNIVLSKVGGGGGSPVNALANGSFESGTTSWNFYTNGSGNFGAIAPGTAGSYAGQVNIATPGTNVQLYQYGFPLTSNTQYVLKFDARANVNRTISVSVQKHVSPYSSFGLNSAPFALTTAWKSFSATFITSGFSGVVNDPRLMIWLAAGDVAGDQYFFDNITLSPASGAAASTELASAVVEQGPTVARGISDIYPNPFNPSTNIRYVLSEPSVVTLKVYSMLGQEVATLVNTTQGAGMYSVVWDGRSSNGIQVGSGVYICRMTGAGESGAPITSVKRMLLLK